MFFLCCSILSDTPSLCSTHLLDFPHPPAYLAARARFDFGAIGGVRSKSHLDSLGNWDIPNQNQPWVSDSADPALVVVSHSGKAVFWVKQNTDHHVQEGA